MQTLTSADGTRIAYDRYGEGPPLILVVGAFNDRRTGEPLAAALSAHHTVYTYDRRGRGDSGDTAPYSVEREVEDLGALIEVAGGSAAAFGFSSGAVLVLTAAARGLPITRLALYDPPLVFDKRPPVDHAAALAGLVGSGRRGDAVEYFQTQVVGMPDEGVAAARHAPFRPALEAMAHTLVYEMTITQAGADLAAVKAPALVLSGGAGSPELERAAGEAAAAMPHARHLSLPGQTHDLVPEVLGPVLREFLRDA